MLLAEIRYIDNFSFYHKKHCCHIFLLQYTSDEEVKKRTVCKKKFRQLVKRKKDKGEIFWCYYPLSSLPIDTIDSFRSKHLETTLRKAS